ncbi:MAG: methionyl-tRNA formyltransferase [Nitrospirota bacterium]
MRIVFFGTPSFSVPSLVKLLDSGEKVIAVVTQPDKRKGRSSVPFPPPVKELALSKGLKILQPVKIKEPSFLIELSNMKPEIIVVVAFGKILSSEILKLPPFGCVNVHASLLPEYRGAAPIQWAIINGGKKTGITTMLMDEGLDTGDILLQEEVEIADTDNAETLGKRLAETGASLLIKTIEGLRDGTIKPIPQIGTPSYAPTFKKEDGKIDWSKTAREIFNFVRGMYPWPGVYCYLNMERIKITKVRVLEGFGKPGRIEKDREKEFIVGTGEGLISITELQPEGKRPMSAADFLHGRRIKEGTFFDET